MMYLERPDATYAWAIGKAEKETPSCPPPPDSFRSCGDSGEEGESFASTPVVVPLRFWEDSTMEEYESAVEGINLTKFAPPLEAMSN